MKCIKLLGLPIVTAILLSFAGTASATITNPPGTPYTGNIHLTSSSISLDGSVKIACKDTTTTVSFANGSTTGTVTTYDTTQCGIDTFNVVSKGTLTINSSGAVISTGAELTVQLHRTVLGFPVTTHCIYKTNNTSMGTLTEGVSPAGIHVGSSPVPEVTTDGACGNDAVWTGSYTVTEPEGVLTID